MFCRNCGATVPSDSKFCRNCGQQPQQAAQPVQQAQPSQQQRPPQQAQQPQQQRPPQLAQQPQQQRPPQQAQQPQQQRPPQQFQQPAQRPPQYSPSAPGVGAPTPPKKGLNKKIIAIIASSAAAVALALVVFFVFFNNPSSPIDNTITGTPRPTASPPISPGTPGTPGTPGGSDPPGAERPNPIDTGWPTGRTPSFEVLAAGFTAYDPRVDMIEVNQALSYGYDTETAEFYVMTSFAARKDTAVFIAFSEPIANEIYLTSYLTVECNGKLLGYMLPFTATDDYTLHFQPRDLSGVGNWEQGGYTFRLFIDDVEAAMRTANFFDTISMTVLAIPVRTIYRGQISSCSGTWRDSMEWLTASFPIARSNVQYILGPELDLTDRQYDLSTEQGMVNAWYALRGRQTPDNDYTAIVGFIRDRVGEEGRTLGWTCGIPASFVSEAASSMAAVVPHEVAHCYLVGDEYEGGSLHVALNVPPYGMRGHDIITRMSAVALNSNVVDGFSVGVDGTGSYIYPQQRPYWAGGWKHLGPVTSYMGGGIPGVGTESFWTSSEVWNHLFKMFTGFSGASDGPLYSGTCPNCLYTITDPNMACQCSACGYLTYVGKDDRTSTCAECGNIDEILWSNYFLECMGCKFFIAYDWFYDINADPLEMPNYMESSSFRTLHIRGRVDTSGAFTPSPWFTYDVSTNRTKIKTSGEYSIYFYDSGGNRVSFSYHDIDFIMQSNIDGELSNRTTETAFLDFSVVYPENAARIVIRKGDREIYSVDISNVTPQVSFTGLSNYDFLGDEVTLTWEASGATDDLYFEIWYCPAMGQLLSVASNVTGRSLTVDLSSYPGTDKGYFIIYATDGVMTGENTSPIIRVQFKAPIILLEQSHLREYKITEAIRMEPRIYDLQDGWLLGNFFDYEDSQVIWWLDGVRYQDFSELMLFPYYLEPEVYVFTLSATNSAGLTTTKNFIITILDDDSDLPDDWSREGIELSLYLGGVLPLDRLDAPVTRGDFADLISTQYGSFRFFASGMDPYDPRPFNPFPDFVEGVITDATNDWDLISWFVPVILGVMDAPDGIFHPIGTMTELEAAVALYRISALALDDPSILDPNASDEAIINWYIMYEIIDTAGPNAFNGSEKLTNRLAMVRYGRFVQFVVVNYLL